MMMLSPNLFANLYLFFSRRRRILYAITLVAIAVSLLAFGRLDMHEDIRSMLPDDRSNAASVFELLQQTPFARKVIVSLDGSADMPDGNLIAAADQLAEAMTPPYFTRVFTGPGESVGWELFSWLIKAESNLITGRDIKKIEQNLTTEHIQRCLKELYARLLTPEGSAMKGLFQVDPLALRFIGMEKLRFLNMIPRMQLKNGHFISSDGRSALLIADTPLAITDAHRSRKMLNHFQRLASAKVPDTIDVSLISGHRYTLANTAAIKRDVFITLICSSLAIFSVFLMFMRTWGGFFVFLVPLAVLSFAAAGVSLVYGRVSAITIGFGAVLLGISVDFAIHVYFALRAQPHNYAPAVAQVSRPIVFSALTTMGAFGVLLFSSLPVQRELAVFSMIGIGAALILSLIIFPHLAKTRPSSKKDGKTDRVQKFNPAGKAILCCWLVLLTVCAWQATKLQFNGDLRVLNLVPDDIRAAEAKLRQAWGDMRGNAVIFAEGPDLQSALETNDRLFQYLSVNQAAEGIVSLAPILPSWASQRTNQQRWIEFWSEENIEHLHQMLISEASAMGFQPDAFTPFIKRLSRRASLVNPGDLKVLGLGEIVNSLIVRTDGRTYVLTVVPDTPLMADLIQERGPELAGVKLASQVQFRQIISRAIADDFLQFILTASVVVIFCLGLLFRNLKMILLALIPVVSGVLFMVGVMGAMGMAFNLINVIAAILIIGLGVDYGIFMVNKLSNATDHSTERAVCVSGLTTLAGFGALVLARHPALHSIGVTVLLGITAAVPSALFVIPAFSRRAWK
jgi:predicted exporter